MARDISDLTPITGSQDLIDYIAGGEKPKSKWKLGTEHEKFPFYVDGNKPVPYDGPRGIRAILEGMQAMLGWEPIMDGPNIIGLVEPGGMGAISLEPGGQFELSGAPLETVHQTCREANAHLAQVREIATPLGIKFLGMGGSPKWSLGETPKMPKSRYQIMTNYMPKVGSQGLDMMYRTCTIQVNLDFASEEDMARKLKVSMKLQPLATALFASSPFTDGKPNGLQSWRGNIWRDTDNNRSGILPFIFDRPFGYGDYVDWALDVPMYFVLRAGHYHDATDTTFRQFLNGALKNRIPGVEPNIGDWTNHLGTLFPDVRLKRYLEMRGADGGPWRRLTALPAFWVGLLYDDAALAAAEDLTKDWRYDDVLHIRNTVPVMGLKTPWRDGSLNDIAREALKISHAGLVARNKLDADGFDESGFLSPLDEVVARGSTLAEVMLKEYNTAWGKSVEPAFLAYAY